MNLSVSTSDDETDKTKSKQCEARGLRHCRRGRFLCLRGKGRFELCEVGQRHPAIEIKVPHGRLCAKVVGKNNEVGDIERTVAVEVTLQNVGEPRDQYIVEEPARILPVALEPLKPNSTTAKSVASPLKGSVAAV